MLLPAMAKAKSKSQGIRCMNNTKQLMLAWRMYGDEWNDVLVSSLDIPAPNVLKRVIWVTGGLNYNAGTPANYDPSLSIAKSPLTPYTANNYEIWKCPSDLAKVKNTAG